MERIAAEVVAVAAIRSPGKGPLRALVGDLGCLAVRCVSRIRKPSSARRSPVGVFVVWRCNARRALAKPRRQVPGTTNLAAPTLSGPIGLSGLHNEQASGEIDPCRSIINTFRRKSCKIPANFPISTPIGGLRKVRRVPGEPRIGREPRPPASRISKPLTPRNKLRYCIYTGKGS